jgi:hypothetical protein
MPDLLFVGGCADGKWHRVTGNKCKIPVPIRRQSSVIPHSVSFPCHEYRREKFCGETAPFELMLLKNLTKDEVRRSWLPVALSAGEPDA